MNASDALFHNWRLKASALGLAVFLWALVQTEPRSEEIFPSVPVLVEIGDTTWTLANQPRPATVELRLDGPAREIIRLAREGAVVRVPIGIVGSGDTLVSIRRDWIDVGQRGGLVIESVSPQSVQLAFERAVTRLVPVSARVQGRVRNDLALATALSVSPRLVRVRGAESRVAALDSVPLLPFDLGRVNGSAVFAVAVDTTGLGGATVTPLSTSLEVRVEDMVERVLDGLAVQADVGPGQPQVVVEPTEVRLTLSGARTLVTAVDRSALRVWVPPEYLEDMAPGEIRRVRVQVDGIPALVTAVPGTEFIRVRRAIDTVGDEEGGPRP